MFYPAKYIDVPSVDLVSWTFGNPVYDLEKPVFIDAKDPSQSLSYNQARSLVRKLISGLQASGLRLGDSVCMHSYNNVNYSLIYLAVIGAGGRFVASNPAYTQTENEHLFTLAEARFLIVEPELLPKVLPAVSTCQIPLKNVFVFNTGGRECPEHMNSWSLLLEHGEKDWMVLDDEKECKTTTAALMSTSGTTGLPKLASLNHYSHVSQSIALYDSADKEYEITRLLCLPQCHAFNAPLAHMAPLREGFPTYIMRRYEINAYVDYIHKYKISETTMVTPIVLNVINLPTSQQDMLSSLRWIWCGGAPLDAVVQNKMISLLHSDIIVTQVWGMTELGWVSTGLFPEKDLTGSVGRLVFGVEAKIMDVHNGHEITADETHGEIYIRSPAAMSCYYKNPAATSATITDGWLCTGDIGYIKLGKWYIVDRAKDLIKVRGWQVSPTEIEACLLSHPAIRDAAVIGVDARDGRGELPRAYIVVESGTDSEATDEDIKTYLSGRLANYKRLDAGIRRVEKIHRSAAGKILRPILREIAKKELVNED